jgi:L-arabonate dehydrase
MAIPAALLKRGITDMVRISDGRMSGTAFGTVVLHVSPEAAIGGTLAIVQTGDEILLDVPNKRLELLLSEEEIRRRKDLLVPFPLHSKRGYVNLYQQHVQQAHLGADLDFLRGKSINTVLRDSH